MPGAQLHIQQQRRVRIVLVIERTKVCAMGTMQIVSVLQERLHICSLCLKNSIT
jgi:hypothetical protein